MSESILFLGHSRFINRNERSKIRKTLSYLADNHTFIIDSLTYIHQTDLELLEVNITHLNHDTYTDIITFDLSDNEGVIDGEIYISVDRVKENALLFGVDFWTEYIRVVSHGLFHLMGYGDKTPEEQAIMRKREEEAIAYWSGLRST